MNLSYLYVLLHNSPFESEHILIVVSGQVFECAHFRFLVTGRQVRDDTRIVGIYNHKSDNAPSESQDSDFVSASIDILIYKY